MLREGIKEDYIKKAIAEANRAVLCLYANLAKQLGFDFSKIVTL